MVAALTARQELRQELLDRTHANQDLAQMKTVQDRSMNELRSRAEEAETEREHLQTRLRAQAIECERLRSRNEELETKLQLDELLRQAQRGRPGEPVSVSAPVRTDPHSASIRALEDRVRTLEAEIQQSTHSIKQLESDRRELAEQLHQERDSARVLREERDNFSALVRSLSDERQLLVIEREQYFTRIVKLEADAARLHNASASIDTAAMQRSAEVERTRYETALASWRTERDALSAESNDLRSQVSQLSAALAKAQASALEKDALIEQLRQAGEQDHEMLADRQRLLAQSRNDAETISRAVAQNRELKERLAELEARFIAVTNEKAELASQLTTPHPALRAGSSAETGAVEAARVGPTDAAVSEPATGVRCAARAADSAGRAGDATSLPGSEAAIDTEPGAHAAAEQPELVRLRMRATELEAELARVAGRYAELERRMQYEQHVIAQLSAEVESIGEYIALYRAERDALRARYRERDQYLAELIDARADVERRMAEIKSITRQLLAERDALRLELGRALMLLPQNASVVGMGGDGDNEVGADGLGAVADERDRPAPAAVPTGPSDATIAAVLDAPIPGSRVMDEFAPCASCTGRVVRV